MVLPPSACPGLCLLTLLTAVRVDGAAVPRRQQGPVSQPVAESGKLLMHQPVYN